MFKISTNDFCNIVYIESYGHYVLIHMQNGSVIKTRSSLKELASLLPAEKFARVHHSFIINLDFVEKIGHTEILLKATFGTLPVGRAFRKNLIQLK